MNRRALLAAAIQSLVAFVIAYALGGPCIAGTTFGLRGALWLAVPVLLLPLQPMLTGRNVLAIAKLGPRPWSLRPLLAWLPTVCWVTGLLLAVLAAARPQITHHQTIVTSSGLDILLALDTSGSMRQDDMMTRRGYASRIEVAKGVAREFVDARPNDRVGMVVFGEEAFTYVPLTLDHETLKDAIDTAEIGMSGSRGTAVGTAIAVAAKRMKELEAPSKIVILVTDGRSNAGRLSPIDAANAAAALNIKVYTIGVGGPSGAFDDGVDEPGLRAVSEATGAHFFRAQDMQALEDVYKTIDALEPSPAKVRDLVEHEERFRCPLTKGALFMLLGALLQATLLRRGP